MIIRLFIAILVIIAVSYAYNQYRQQPKSKRKKLVLKSGFWLVGGAVLLLVATGRVHWITAIFAGIVPFISRIIPLAIRILPFLSQLQKQRMAGRMFSGDTSTLHTRFIRLNMDQDSGRLTGEVLEGLFAGKTLEELSQDEVRELLDFYRQNDPESEKLLYAFLQYRNRNENFSRPGGEAPGSRGGDMSRSEAYEILGLEEGASKQEILAAHKKLMQRLHPDRGGSNYLAIKVNQAKDLLTKR